MSLEPSGIQTLVTQGVPSALPIAAPIRRQAMPWSIQNRRIAGVGVGQREAVGRQRVGEIRGVEVQADPPGLRPVDPALEMLGLERIALDLPAAGLGVAGVQIQAVRAGNERQGLVQVAAQLVGRAGLAGIIAGDGQAAAQLLADCLKPADVVALPAVQRDRDGGQPLERASRHRRPIPRYCFARQAKAPVPAVSTAETMLVIRLNAPLRIRADASEPWSQNRPTGQFCSLNAARSTSSHRPSQ